MNNIEKNIFLSHNIIEETSERLIDIIGNIEKSLETNGFKILSNQKDCGVFMPLIVSNHKLEEMITHSKLALELKQRYIHIYKNGIIIPEFQINSYKQISFTNYEQLFNQLKYFK